MSYCDSYWGFLYSYRSLEMLILFQKNPPNNAKFSEFREDASILQGQRRRVLVFRRRRDLFSFFPLREEERRLPRVHIFCSRSLQKNL